MLIEHLERALRGAGISVFEIALRKGVDGFELESSGALEIAPDDRDRVERELEALAGKESPELVVEYRSTGQGNGRVHWRRARGALVRNEHGVPTHLVGSTQDITPLKESQEETRRLQRCLEQAVLEQAVQARRAEQEAQHALEQERLVKSAEEEARRTLELLQLATRLSEVTVWSFDLSGGDMASAKAFLVNLPESLGYVPEEMPADMAATLELVIHPEDRPRLMAEVRAYLDGRSEKFEAEYRVRRKDGSVEWKVGRGVAIRDADGRPTRLTGTSVFVTHIKQAEAELRAINEKFDLAMQLFDFRVMEIDLRGAASPAEAVISRSWNRDGRGLRTQTLASFIDHIEHNVLAEDVPRALELLDAAIRGDIPEAALEFRARNPAGAGFRWRVGRVKVYCDEGGVPERCITLSNDIQQIKTAEEEARRAAEQLRVATDLSGVGTWCYEFEGGDLATAKSPFTVDGTIEELGYDDGDVPRDLVGRMLTILLPEDRPRVYQELHDYLAGKSPQFETAYRLIQKDGQPRWKLSRGILTRDATGRPLTLMGTAIDITQLKQTQEELQQVKDRLEFALRASNTATWDLETPDGTITGGIPVFTNAWEQCGYDAPSDPYLAARVLSALLPPGEAERFMANVQAFFDGTGREWEIEQRVLHKDGTERWHLKRGVVARNASGRVTRFTGTSIDITERKVMEGELQRVKDRLELAVLGSGACTWDFDLPDGKIVNAIPVFTNAWELCGYDVPSDPHLASQALSVLLPAEDVEPFTERVQAFFDGTGCEWDTEVRVIHKDGEEGWLTGRGVVVRDARGRATRFIGLSIDITDRKQMERALLESEERFRRTFENAAVGMILADIDGKFLEYNGRFCDFLGYSPEELAGRRLFEFMNPDEATLHLEHQQRVVRGRSPAFTRDTRYLRKDGAVVWGNVTLSVIQRHADGTPVRVMGILQDITERKTLEATLEVATRLSRVYSWSFELEDGKIDSARATFVNVWESLGYDSPPEAARFGPAMTLVILPEDQPAVWRAVLACLEGRTPEFEAEYRIRHADGSIHWNLGRGIVTRDASGRPLRFLGTSVDVTELKRVQEEARKNKERLELAVLGSRACTWDFDLTDGTIANARATYTNVWELLGHHGTDHSGTFGDGLVSLVHPDARPHFVARVQSFLDGREREFESEIRCRFMDGSDRWQLARGVVERDARGRAVRFTGSSVDITDRKEMESAVHESEARFRGTFQNAAVGMILTDVHGKVLECNRRFCDFLGYSPEELAGRCLFEFMDPGEATSHLEHQHRVVRGESPAFMRDTRYFRKGGAVVWGNVTLSVIQRHADGTPAHVMAIVQDITERKALEAEIRQARETLELAMRGSDTSVVVIDVPGGDLRDSHWRAFNLWEAMGADPAAVPSAFEDRTRLLIHPDDHDAVLASFLAAAEHGRPDYYIEHRHFHADGSVRWRLLRGTILYDDAGNLSRFIATATDITRLKQIESELSRASEAAEAANRAKDEFLANVSHEIRTPMNAILGMTELALDSAPSDHQRHLLSTVRSAAKNLLGIINDLLDFSKIASGKMTLDRAPFSLRAAVGDTVRALAVRAHRKGLELLCQVRAEVPDALDGDAGRLRQVLMNLVGNAIKFTQRGEVEVEVDVVPSSDAHTVPIVFTVRDTGIGIAPEKQTAIFRAFEQEDSSTTRNYGGTGLGLTLSAQLAEMMGGGITLESAPGRGSTFSFIARFARSSRSEGAMASPERLAELRVLVVDDNETNRRILEVWLKTWRMRPTAVGDAAAAIRELARAHDAGTPFALVLLDARMPDTDGVTLAGQIRQRWDAPAPRLILLSSDDNPALPARSRENGVLAYLLKPVQQSELLEAIWAVMNLDLILPGAVAKAGVQAEGPFSLRVLVAEDNDLNVALLRELLRQRGHQVQFARDGRCALELALRGDCDLMLLDLHMPELDGVEVARAIRERERGTDRHLPIIALTARSSARDRDRCLAAGMDEFLSKPIEAAVLWAAVDQLMTRWPPAGRGPGHVEPGLLDPRAILRSIDGQASLLEKLLPVFRKTLTSQSSAIRAARADGDFALLREAAHRLAGTVGAFSTVTADVASTLEDAAVRQEPESCAALVEQLGSMCDALLEATATLSIDSLVL